MPAKTLKRKVTKKIEEQVQSALTALEKMSTRRDRENLTRFGITTRFPLAEGLLHRSLWHR